ncbi:hypothetical protein MBANPS3_000141 [Mucor bainieri]
MSNLKRRHQDVSEADSSSSLNSIQMNSTNEPPYDTSYFPLPNTRFPLGTPVQSKRSRKLYSDLADEREFLLHLKELWKSKLANLQVLFHQIKFSCDAHALNQEDKRLLEKMKDAKKHDVIHEETLFCPVEEEEEKQLSDDNVLDAVSVDPPMVMESEDQEDQPDSFKIVNGQVVVKDPSMLATLQELDKIYMESHNAQQIPSSDEEEVDENDDDARQALHKMLEEFGGGF